MSQAIENKNALNNSIALGNLSKTLAAALFSDMFCYIFKDPLPDDSSADSVKVSDLVGGVH